MATLPEAADAALAALMQASSISADKACAAVAALLASADDVAACTLACEVIAGLAKADHYFSEAADGDGTTTELIARRAPAAIVDALSKHAPDAALCRAACRAMTYLIKRGGGGADAAIEAGALSALTVAISTHTDDEVVCFFACGLLCALLSSKTVLDAAVAASLCAALEHVLRACPANKDLRVAESTCRHLIYVASGRAAQDAAERVAAGDHERPVINLVNPIDYPRFRVDNPSPLVMLRALNLSALERSGRGTRVGRVGGGQRLTLLRAVETES